MVYNGEDKVRKQIRKLEQKYRKEVKRIWMTTKINMRRQRQRNIMETAVVKLDLKKCSKLSNWLSLTLKHIALFFIFELHKSLKRGIGFNLLQLSPLAGSLLGVIFPLLFVFWEGTKEKGCLGSQFHSSECFLTAKLNICFPSGTDVAGFCSMAQGWNAGDEV